MSLSKRAVETLIDLVEIKLSCMETYDREDSREIAGLEQCKTELLALGQPAAAVVAFAGRTRGRSRAAAG